MLPVLFRIGPLSIHSYGMMLAVGFLVGAWLLRRDLRRWHLPEDLADRTAVAAMIGGIVGAKLYFALVEAPSEFWAHPLATLFSGAGLTFYGGLAGAIILLLWVFRRARVSVVHMADLIAPIIVLGYGFGRVGCFLSGDGDYGPPTSLLWGMSFPHGTVPTTLHVHPTPLYEIILMWGGFAFLWFWLRRRNPPRGVMTGAAFLVMGVERVVTEFWRLDSGVLAAANYDVAHGTTPAEIAAFRIAVEVHRAYAGLSITQWVSIVLALVGLVIVWTRRAAPRAIPPGDKGRERSARKEPAPPR